MVIQQLPLKHDLAHRLKIHWCVTAAEAADQRDQNPSERSSVQEQSDSAADGLGATAVGSRPDQSSGKE